MDVNGGEQWNHVVLKIDQFRFDGTGTLANLSSLVTMEDQGILCDAMYYSPVKWYDYFRVHCRF